MTHYDFPCHGTCSVQVSFDLDDEKKLHNVVFIRGCDGNLKAIGRLAEGQDAAHIASLLKGNLCRDKQTSCADQLALAIEKALR